MTMRARTVLADCEYALADFDASVNALEYMKPRWLSLIALLRTVGHVLVKVDRAAADQAVSMRIDVAWNQLASTTRPHIFHDFIEAERNDTLKQYEIGAAPNQQIHGAWTLQGAPLYVSHVPGAAALLAELPRFDCHGVTARGPKVQGQRLRVS